MSMQRSTLDFPRNEAGLVDEFIGTAYDTVKHVSDNMDMLGEISAAIDDIDGIAERAVDAALDAEMPAIRTELQAYVAAGSESATQAAASALSAAQSANLAGTYRDAAAGFADDAEASAQAAGTAVDSRILAFRQELAGSTGGNLVGTLSPLAQAIARTLTSKLSDVVSVKDFAAVGDGTTDATLSFTQARAGTPDALVPDGKYVVDGQSVYIGDYHGSAAAVLKYKTGQSVSLERAGNASALDQLYWQEIQAAPGTTLNLNTTNQALGICEDVLYMAQNVWTPSGSWAFDSVGRFSSFPLARAASDDVDITVTGGTAPLEVVDLVGVGHAAGASVIRENGKLWLYSTVSCPSDQTPIDGVGCNYGTGFTKTEWKGPLTQSADVQPFRNLQGVFSAEICVSADGRFIVAAGYRYSPVVRDSTSYYSAIPHVSVFDRLAVEAAADPSTVVPLHSYPVPYVQSMGDAIGSLAGVACDGELIYLLNGGAQVVGARTLLVFTLSGDMVKSQIMGGWAAAQPELFRKGAGGKLVFAYESEGLVFHEDKLMVMSKFNVCTPSKVVSWQGKNFFPTVASTGVAPSSFGSWARTEAPATEAFVLGNSYVAPTDLVYHKYLTALAPKGRYSRPKGVTGGLYVDCQNPSYSGVYGNDAGYNVYTHLFWGQFDRNSETVWPMLEWRSSGQGRLFHCDQVKSGSYDAASYFGRLAYTYESGTLISGGPSVALAATLELGNARNTSSGASYATMWATGTRRMLWGVNNISYANFNPNADGTLNVGSSNFRWNTYYGVTGAISTSDAREKTPVRKFTENELTASQALIDELGIYQWLRMIEEKGEDAARLHAGMTVQRAIEIMEQHGLEPMRYGFICYDEWEAEPAVYDRTPEVRDDDGNILHPATETLVTPAHPAGNKYSFRMDELKFFILAGVHAGMKSLDARLSALENK